MVNMALPGMLLAETERGVFDVVSARTDKDEDTYLLNTKLVINLSSGALKALNNGVPLVIEFHIQVLETHKWLWDTVITEIRKKRQISYHALSRTYIIRDIDTSRQQNFRNLDDALLMAGVLEDLPVFDARILGDKKNYAMRVRGSLDIESLPTPLRLLAYVSSGWDTNSEWHKWQLVR